MARTVTDLWRREGWDVGTERVYTIWRHEGLKVPTKQPKRARLWRADGSCLRLRPAYRNHVWSLSASFARRLLTSISDPLKPLSFHSLSTIAQNLCSRPIAPVQATMTWSSTICSFSVCCSIVRNCPAGNVAELSVPITTLSLQKRPTMAVID